MSRRALYRMLLVVLSVVSSACFVVFPLWQIEHPGDASLVLRSERHPLWQRPLHAHLDPAAIAIPVLAIAVVATALLTLRVHND
jgi:hypothetical protein